MVNVVSDTLTVKPPWVSVKFVAHKTCGIITDTTNKHNSKVNFFILILIAVF